MLSPAEASFEHPVVASAGFADREKVLRKVLRVALWLVALALVATFGVGLIAQNSLTPVEGIVAIHSHMLAQGHGLYYDLSHYPYTVTAYGPIFYGLSALLELAGLPVYAGGRILAFLALLGSLWSGWRILQRLTRSDVASLTGLVLAGVSSNVLYWGTTGQVDMLAIGFSLAAFASFLEWRESGSGLWLSSLLVVLAVFTKQTAVPAGAAIALTLLWEDRRTALRWISVTALAGAAVVGVLHWATGGHYLENAVFANINPFAIEKLAAQGQYFLLTAGGLLLAMLCGLRTLTTRSMPVFLYAGLAAIVWLLTAAKVGSDLNYQVEMTLVMALGAAVVLQESGFFDALLHNRKTWLTMLQIPLLLFVGLNLTLTVRTIVERFFYDSIKTQANRELRPYLGPDRKRVLVPNYDAMRQLRGGIEIETLIYTLLVDAGRIDPKPVLRDIETGQFATIVLPMDLGDKDKPEWLNDEVNPLPKSHLEAIRKHYRLVKHLDGAYLNGDYIYEPARH